MPEQKNWKTLFAGGIAGCVARTTVAPLERLKCEMQVSRQLGSTLGARVFPALIGMYKRDGLIALWRGNFANCIRVFPAIATQFLVVENWKKHGVRFGGDDSTQSPLDRLAGGALAGMAGVSLTYPLDLVRSRITLQGAGTKTAYTGILNALVTIGREEGMHGLYKGLNLTMLGIIPYVGTQFSVYGTIKQHVMDAWDDGESVPVWLSLTCGAVAGATAQTVAYPFDGLRRRFQVDSFVIQKSSAPSPYTGVLSAFRHVIRTEGVRALYSGLMPNYLKVAPMTAVQFTTYEQLKRLM